MNEFLKVSLLISLLSLSSGTFAEEYWQQYLQYEMDITLNTEQKQVSGSQVIVYHNQSPDTLHDIFMHVYPNAFKNEQTLRSREGRRWYNQPPKGLNRSWVDIESFLIKYGNSTSTDYRVDDTVLHASIPSPLPPGDSLIIDLTFIHHLRQHMGRAGYRGEHYDMAQWYPKMAVYDEDGWDNEPWHYEGEFYGEFGDFEVTIHVPFNYIIGATGLVINGDPGWSDVQYDGSENYSEWLKQYRSVQETLADFEKSRSVTFSAKNVHDFAWATSPNFVYEYGSQGDTDIHVLYRYEQGRAWNTKTMNQAKSALEWLENQFGEYAYPQVTVTHGLLGGGMEYPMLIMNGYVDEGLVVHEIGHIFFYGLLANDEMNAAWLDEGFTTFQERRYMIHHYGKEGRSLEEINYNYPGYLGFFPRESDYEAMQNRIVDMQLSGNDETLAKPSHAYGSETSYEQNVYTKGALMLWMLEYVMGEDAFWAGMRNYYETWQFRHVNEERFRSIMAEHTDQNLDWFFDQWLHETGYVDYALTDIESNPDGEGYSTRVQFSRLGEFIMPLEIEVQSVNGSSATMHWFEHAETGEVTVQTDNPIERVLLDPDNRILDVNYLNNVSGWKEHNLHIQHPAIEYNPRTKFAASWYPTQWYNDVDGLKFGLRFQRAYDETRKKVDFSAWFGAKSQALDYHMGYSDELFHFSPNLRYDIDLLKLEGRQWNEVSLEKSWWRAYQHRPKTTLGFSFRNISFFENDYLSRPWNSGVNNQIKFTFDYKFQGVNWTAGLNTKLTSSDSWLGSDFQFNKAQFSLEFNGEEPGTNLIARIFGGSVLPGGEIPFQEKYSVAGGGVYEEFQHFYTRSRGSLFGRKSLADNVYIPGDGNIRGYYGSGLPFADHLLALNLEFHIHYYSYYDRVKPTLIFFAGAARAGLNGTYDDTIDAWESMAEFGIGIKMDQRIMMVPFTFRVDVPLWKNDLESLGQDSEQFSPKLLLSFESLLN